MLLRKEEHGTKTHDGKNVGKEDDVRIFGNRKYGRNRVNRKDQIGKFNDQDNYE